LTQRRGSSPDQEKPMNSKAIDAVFERGVFRPLGPLGASLTEGQHVRIVIEREQPAQEILALASKVYEGLSEQDINEIERGATDRRTSFS
jgi:predicted DNA-binding antitoxin AbrB/MazE fold protein